jgi:hypothetical protein
LNQDEDIKNKGIEILDKIEEKTQEKVLETKIEDQ